MRAKPEILLIGHVFAPIGRGEDVRCTYRALRSIGVRVKVLDIFGGQESEPSRLQLQLHSDLAGCPGAVNIFHINGDEVPHVMRHLSFLDFTSSINVIYPAWELEAYPLCWASYLDEFDEIWAPSTFIESALAPVVKKPLRHVPLAAEVFLEEMLPRRYFGIPETAFAFLFSFDFRSYVSRKNPEGVIAAFEELLRRSPDLDTVLVVKMHGAREAGVYSGNLLERLEGLGDRVVVIDRTMSDSEVKNLIRVCDCYVSLHRSEGFGRGLAEAMFMSRPVIATGFSGNLEFMSSDNALLVDYRMIDIRENEYPFGLGQRWANPNLKHASACMHSLVTHPDLGRALGRKAEIAVRKRVGFRVSALRYLDNLRRLLGTPVAPGVNS